MIRPPPISPLFPHPTLFRSCCSSTSRPRISAPPPVITIPRSTMSLASSGGVISRARRTASRSEEHTSELQSQSNLVCRLLLEKKKKDIQDDSEHSDKHAT